MGWVWQIPIPFIGKFQDYENRQELRVNLQGYHKDLANAGANVQQATGEIENTIADLKRSINRHTPEQLTTQINECQQGLQYSQQNINQMQRTISQSQKYVQEQRVLQQQVQKLEKNNADYQAKIHSNQSKAHECIKTLSLEKRTSLLSEL